MLVPLKTTTKYFAVTIVLLLFITPFVASTEMYNGIISAKEFWFLGVVALIFVYWAIKLVITRPQTFKVKTNFNLPDILLITFYVYYFIRALCASHIPILYSHKLQMMTGGIAVYFFIKWSIQTFKSSNNQTIKQSNSENLSHTSISPFTHIIIVAFLLSGLIQSIYGLLQLYGVYPSNDNYFKVTGSFFNPAPYALYLAIVFPMALGTYLLTLKNKIQKDETNSSLQTLTHYLSLATFIAILLVLPVTLIRASWLGALAGLLVVLWFATKQKIITLPQWITNLFASKIHRTVIIILGITIIAVSSVFLYNLKKDSSIGKTFIWEVTLGKIVEKPLFGHGLDRFEAEYNNWQAEYFQNHPNEMEGPKGLAAGNTKYAFNDYLELVSETGIVGLGLFLASIIVLIIGSVKKLKNERNGYLISVLASLMSLLTISALSYPFYNAPTLVLFFIVMGIASAAIEPMFYKPTKSHFIIPTSIALKHIISLFLIASATGIGYKLYHKRIAYKNWYYANYTYNAGYYSEANTIYEANFEHLKYNGIFLQRYGKSLQMAARNTQAITILEQTCKLTSDQVLYCILGDAFKAEKEYKKAETAYLFAASMEPNKLYPHYLLAKLYHASGQQEEAILKANEVLTKDAKVESMAVNEIKNEMKKLLSKKISKRDILYEIE